MRRIHARPLQLGALALYVLALASDAGAAPDAACWYRALEQADDTTNPPQGGDNEFFTSSDVPPNVLWVLDTSGSMQTLPCNGDCGDYRNCGGGFSGYGNQYFVNRGWRGFTDDVGAYPAFDPEYCSTAGDPRAFSGSDGCYKPGVVYRPHAFCTAWPSSGRVWVPDASTDAAAFVDSWCATRFPAETPTSPAASPSTCVIDIDCAVGYRCLTPTGATSGSGLRCRVPANCSSAALYTCPDTFACNPGNGRCERQVERDACITQLRTYGYHPGSTALSTVFLGDVLNFHPAKFVVARKVLKDLVGKTRKTRQGLIVFDTDGLPGSDGNGGRLLTEFGPTCDRFRFGGVAVIPNDSEFTLNSDALKARIGTLKFVSGTPLGETLTSACQYLSGSQIRFRNTVKVNGSSGVGTYDNDIPNRSGNADPICFSCQKSFVVVITDGSPSIDGNVPCKLRNYDRDCKEGLAPSPSCSSVGTGTCPSSQRRSWPQFEGYDYFDDVANFCFAEDLRPDLSDVQNAVVHTVGFGVRAPILEDAAAKGGGVNIYADDADELRNALAAVVADVNKRATSFSVASVTTVQTRGSTYAFVPRFKPSADDLWEGHLYRFKLFNEFAAGCTADDTVAPATAAKLSRNPNGDDDCDDVFLQDATNAFVQEDVDGEYLVADTSRPWSDVTGWSPRSPATKATPVWDSMERLLSRNLTLDAREIHTVVDGDAGGAFEPSEQLAFNVANVDRLLPSLALGGVAGPFCPRWAARLGKTYATERDCAIDLIQFVRGVDLLDEDRDGLRTDARPLILGDIFHSSPILVTAPVAPYLCDLGVATQCVFSLYSPRLTPDGPAQYGAWAAAMRERTQFVLVGANDGMLHAFNAGDWQAGDDPDTTVVEDRHLNLGTGREMWAFIPPDMLPRLKRLAVRDGRHALLVDGTAMVRDIWVDSTTRPGFKDADEFHTIAVVGERQGGRSWFALDVTTPGTPKFRWVYPPVGDTRGLEGGETWNDFAPSGPPIGPVAVAAAGGAVAVDGRRANETWAVFLNGGYDAAFARGRSVSALDVWTGRELWRFAAADATGGADPRSGLFPVAAPVTMLDLGGDFRTRGPQDGLFDTAVVGDVMGQVWALRFYVPGEDVNADGAFDNWHGARAFVQHKGDSLSRRNPFFQLAEATVAQDSGAVRVHVGSGDRANIRDRNGGDCGLLNLSACIRKRCVVRVDPADAVLGALFLDALLDHRTGDTAFTQNLLITDAVGASASCSDVTDVRFTVNVSCENGTVNGIWSWGLQCDWNASDGSLCGVVNGRSEPLLATVQVAAPTENNRFYTFELFSSSRPPFTSAMEALSYDASALSDVNLSDAEVTAGGPGGWYVPYALQDERTSSAGTVLGGCVLWNSLKPDLTPLACGAKVEDEARLYRAHFATGSRACGSMSSTAIRSIVRKSIVPPPAPTPVVSFNSRTGEVRYSMVAVEPGVPPVQTNVGAGDLAGIIYWLEVSRELHACRHGIGDCN